MYEKGTFWLQQPLETARKVSIAVAEHRESRVEEYHEGRVEEYYESRVEEHHESRAGGRRQGRDRQVEGHHGGSVAVRGFVPEMGESLEQKLGELYEKEAGVRLKR